MLVRLGNRHHRQPVAFEDPVDRDDWHCVAGGHRACQRGNNPSDEAAQKQSRSDMLEPDAGHVPHGTTPKPRRSERKSVKYQEAQKYGRQR